MKRKRKKNFEKVLTVALFLIIPIISFSKNEFLAVGNIKIVRPEPLVIKREDLNITIEKDRTVKVESIYTFENSGERNIKSTFLFWLDQSAEKKEKEDFSNKNSNNRGKYIRNLKFYSDYRKSKSLRAVIKFDENIYENQDNENIQREWHAISKVIPPLETGYLIVNYDLYNTNFDKKRSFTYSFELVNNFHEKNKAEILYINIYNRSGRLIESISYKGYDFKKIKKKNGTEHYELLEGNVNLDGKMTINFK